MINFKCEHPHNIDIDQPCKPTYKCYVNSPEHFNCFFVYMHYNKEKEHTLQEVAHLLNMSHTTVKCIEEQALIKLRDFVKNNISGLNEFKKRKDN